MTGEQEGRERGKAVDNPPDQVLHLPYRTLTAIELLVADSKLKLQPIHSRPKLGGFRGRNKRK